LFCSPAAWAAVYHFGGGVDAVMLSLTVYVALIAVILAARFASGRWKNIDLLAGREPQVI